jgi:hypothetical protein
MTELIRWGPSLFGHAEFLLLLFYAERTLAYGKSADSASLAQINGGVFSRRKNLWIRGSAGISATAAKKANVALSERGVLIRRRALPGEARYQAARGNEATEYEINWPALQAEITQLKSAPLGHVVTKPLGHQAPKPLSHVVPYNRGESSSEEINNREASATRVGTRVKGKSVKNPSLENADDEISPEVVFGSPKVELAHLIHLRGALLSEAEWWKISADLEIRGIDVGEFVAYLRPHLKNPKINNPIGLVKSKIKSFQAATRPAVTPADLVAPPVRVEKCSICREEKGKGTTLDGDRLAPCECATPEWRAKLELMNHQAQERRRGNQ